MVPLFLLGLQWRLSGLLVEKVFIAHAKWNLTFGVTSVRYGLRRKRHQSARG